MEKNCALQKSAQIQNAQSNEFSKSDCACVIQSRLDNASLSVPQSAPPSH